MFTIKYAALSTHSSLLMYAGAKKDLSDAIADYASIVGIPLREAGHGVVWYRLDQGTEIDDWTAEGDDDQWTTFEENSNLIPGYLLKVAIGEALHRKDISTGRVLSPL